MKIRVFALAVLLFACGAPEPPTEPIPQTTTTQATTIETTTEAVTTTTAATTTQKQATTQKATTSKPATQTTADTNPAEKPPPLRFLSYKMDQNGIFYIDYDSSYTEVADFYISPNSSFVQMVYSLIRVGFRYNEQDWMIQIWKGRYGLVMMGGEISVFKKSKEQYVSAMPSEEPMMMQIDVYQRNFLTRKTAHLFTRGPASEWRYNGFVPGKFNEENRKDEIIMVGAITFPDQEMLEAFEEPFAAAGFTKSRRTPDHSRPETYAVSGNTLKFSWQYIDMDA